MSSHKIFYFKNFVLRHTICGSIKTDSDRCIFNVFIIKMTGDALSVLRTAMVEVEQI